MLEAGEMAHQVKTLATKLSDLSSAYMVEGETQLPYVVFGPPHTCNSTLNK